MPPRVVRALLGAPRERTAQILPGYFESQTWFCVNSRSNEAARSVMAEMRVAPRAV